MSHHGGGRRWATQWASDIINLRFKLRTAVTFFTAFIISRKLNFKFEAVTGRKLRFSVFRRTIYKNIKVACLTEEYGRTKHFVRGCIAYQSLFKVAEEARHDDPRVTHLRPLLQRNMSSKVMELADDVLGAKTKGEVGAEDQGTGRGIETNLGSVGVRVLKSVSSSNLDKGDSSVSRDGEASLSSKSLASPSLTQPEAASRPSNRPRKLSHTSALRKEGLSETELWSLWGAKRFKAKVRRPSIPRASTDITRSAVLHACT
jgi:hypothetical protein